jgi:pimeloyl-ACP methyl ester carboxylesterase
MLQVPSSNSQERQRSGALRTSQANISTARPTIYTQGIAHHVKEPIQSFLSLLRYMDQDITRNTGTSISSPSTHSSTKLPLGDIPSEPQISTEVEILANILAQLKVGSIIRGTKFDKIVGVGHSYGSFQVQAITKGYPALLDAAILTAYSADSSNAAEFLVASNYEIAKDVFPQKFGHRPSYWLVTPSDSAIISTFFWPPNYDSEAFTFSRNNVDVISLGSYTTVAGVVGTAPDFTGKVHVITGDKDLSSCHYNCSTGGPVAAVKQYYPNPLCNFTYQIVPNTGHSIVPHYTGPQVLEDMLDFIKDI